MALIDRRGVLVTGLASVASLHAPALAGAAVKPLRILILGGTSFLGPPMVETAIARGHTVTLFNRGRTNPHLFPRVEKLRGDRNGNLRSLQGRTWDAVIDNSGFVPRHVRDTARLLRGSGQYLFTSTVSVYASFSGTSVKESDRLGQLPDPTVERVTGRTYGPLKAYCEAEVRKVFGDRATLVRPGFLVGPRDRTDRWTYWPVRYSLGGEMLAPGSPSDPVQFIDVRDVAAWFVHLAEQRIGGAFNAVGPANGLSMSGMFQSIRQAVRRDTKLAWVDSDFLRSQGITVPIWLPPRGTSAAFHRVENRKALAAGLKLRPVARTAADTLKWWSKLSADRRQTMRAGLRATPLLPPGPASFQAVLAEEKSLIALWRKQRSKR